MVKLDVFEVVPRLPDSTTAFDVAKMLKLDAGYTYRAMRAACSANVLVENQDHSFSLTAKGSLLLKDSVPSLRASILLEASDEHTTTWLGLDQVIRMGSDTNGMKERLGVSGFVELLDTNKNYASVFGDAMTSYSMVKLIFYSKKV